MLIPNIKGVNKVIGCFSWKKWAIYRASKVLLVQLNGGANCVVFVSISSRNDRFWTTIQLHQ